MEGFKRSWWDQVADLLPNCFRLPYSSYSDDDLLLEPPKHYSKERRAGFSSVHFQKEKVFKKIDKAIQRGNVTELQAALYGLDFADFEDSTYDWTFLKKACERDALDMAAVLLRHNADANHFGGSSVLPLHVAVRRGNLAMCALLLSKGAHVSAMTKYEHKSPLHFAALGSRVRIAELLLEFRHEVDSEDIYGETPLHTACRMGNNKIVELLLNKKASIDAYDKEGWTGLHLAAESGHVSTVSLLLDHRGNINAQNVYGRTPLSWACASGRVTVVQDLLTRGADANIKDHHNKLAYQYAHNDSIRKLVQLHTTQQTEPFYSTIGILVRIDPRQTRSESSTATVVNVLKLWQPVARETALASGGTKDADGKDAGETTHSRHRLHASLALIPEEDSQQAGADTCAIKEKAFESAYKALSSATVQGLMGLETELESVRSFVKMSRNASVTSKNEIVENMLLCVANLARHVEGLRQSCECDFKSTLVMYNDSLKERSRGQDTGASHTAIVNLLVRTVAEYVASEDDGWRAFLKQLPLPSDLRNTLLVKLSMEETCPIEKASYLLQYWARNSEAFTSNQERTFFMRGVLMALKKCDFGGAGDGIRVVTSKLFQTSQDFKTGLSTNTEGSLDAILQALSAKERNALHNDIKLAASDADIFPDLQELTSPSPPDAKNGDPDKETHGCEPSLRDTLVEAVEREEYNTVAILIEHLILNKYEHLLTHLL